MAMLQYPSWEKLTSHAVEAQTFSLHQMFAEDPSRADRLSIEAAGLYLDYSKNLINSTTIDLFRELSLEAGFSSAIQQMFTGADINKTAQRPALHTLLRTKSSEVPKDLSGEGVQIAAVLQQMNNISAAIRQGNWRGYSRQTIKHIVHLGIGGSYLGPRLLDEALTPLQNREIQCHYIANVDGQHISQVLAGLDAAQTLIVIVSKSFSTPETMTNAATSRKWLLTYMDEVALPQHLIGITSNVQAAIEFGISKANILPIWNWVGGRYSLWSAVSLPIAIRYGYDLFEEVLTGASSMDKHFSETDMPHNMPMMLAWLGIWYQHFFGAESHAILPYDHSLRSLPQHMQQLDMESNGKTIRMDGSHVEYPTGSIVWGGEGTNGQHAFHQLLHQGTRFVGLDFVMPLKPHHEYQEHHDQLVANCFSQSQALMLGRNSTQITDAATPLQQQHKQMPGNRPSNTILLHQVTPGSLGALIALYEHKVFCQAIFWQINPFDQWGVELGKELADDLYSFFKDGTGLDINNSDGSTQALIERYKNVRNNQS